MEPIIYAVIGIVILIILFKIFKAFIKWSAILLIVLLALAYFTNPEESKHHESLNDMVKELPIKKIKKKFVKVEDYKIFSITKVTVEGKEKIIGVGAFGKVWYFNKIEEKLKRNIE